MSTIEFCRRQTIEAENARGGDPRGNQPGRTPTPVVSDSSKANVIANVQALRALAAFLVVFVHLDSLAVRAGIPSGAFVFGNVGVDLFFVLSGLIMVFTTERRDISACAFFRNRVARVVPFYWVITSVVFVIALVAPNVMQSTRADLTDLALSMLFVPFMKDNGLMQPLVFVGWTLNYEMMFYALFAAGMLTGRRLLGLAITGLILLVAVAYGAIIRPVSPLAQFYTAPLAAEFAFGMVLTRIVPLLPSTRMLTVLSFITAAAALVLLVVGPLLWEDTDRLFVAGVPAAFLVGSALYLERVGWVVSNPRVQLLGDASYSIYLTHFFVTQAVTKAVLILGIGGLWIMGAVGFATFVLVGITGVIVHRHIERPLIKSTRALIRIDWSSRLSERGRQSRGLNSPTPDVPVVASSSRSKA